MRVGPRFSDISRDTGIPVSTVRYILLKRLPKLGLSVRASINYGALGLQRYLVEFKSKYPPHYISSILDLLGESMYLDYYTYSMSGKKFFTTFAIPPSYESSFLEFLQTLELLGLVENMDVRKLAYTQLLPFMVEFFDFSRGVWLQDWVNHMRSREVQELVEYPDPNLGIDKIDLMMLAELQKQVIPLKYNIFAKKFNLSRQTISKHFRHIQKLIKLFIILWFPAMNPELITSPLMIKTSYKSDVRKTLLSIPFTYAEMRSERGEYFAMLMLPSIGFYTTFKFLTELIELDELIFQNMEYSGKFSIQYQLYKEGSWINPFEEGARNLLEIVQKQKKNRSKRIDDGLLA
jgi:DNA-binding Lrp family transcriptional regulator